MPNDQLAGMNPEDPAASGPDVRWVSTPAAGGEPQDPAADGCPPPLPTPPVEPRKLAFDWVVMAGPRRFFGDYVATIGYSDDGNPLRVQYVATLAVNPVWRLLSGAPGYHTAREAWDAGWGYVLDLEAHPYRPRKRGPRRVLNALLGWTGRAR